MCNSTFIPKSSNIYARYVQDGYASDITRTFPAKSVPKEFWNIGIRIEDDALVTAKGCELMTRGVPMKAGDIEALMCG